MVAPRANTARHIIDAAYHVLRTCTQLIYEDLRTLMKKCGVCEIINEGM